MLIYYEILHKRGAGIVGYAPHEARPTPLFLAAAAHPCRQCIRSLPRCAAARVLYATTAIAQECNAHGVSAAIVFVLAKVFVDDGIRPIVLPSNHHDVVVDIAFARRDPSPPGEVHAEFVAFVDILRQCLFGRTWGRRRARVLGWEIRRFRIPVLFMSLFFRFGFRFRSESSRHYFDVPEPIPAINFPIFFLRKTVPALFSPS